MTEGLCKEAEGVGPKKMFGAYHNQQQQSPRECSQETQPRIHAVERQIVGQDLPSYGPAKSSIRQVAKGVVQGPGKFIPYLPAAKTTPLQKMHPYFYMDILKKTQFYYVSL